MYQGNITAFFPNKHYGFIVGEDNTEYFFHVSAVTHYSKTLVRKSAPVTFEIGEGKKGVYAKHITVLDSIKGRVLVKRFITSKTAIPDIQVNDMKPFLTRAYKEESEAVKRFKEIVRLSGCNAALGVRTYKVGTPTGVKFRYGGNLGIATKEVVKPVLQSSDFITYSQLAALGRSFESSLSKIAKAEGTLPRTFMEKVFIKLVVLPASVFLICVLAVEIYKNNLFIG